MQVKNKSTDIPGAEAQVPSGSAAPSPTDRVQQVAADDIAERLFKKMLEEVNDYAILLLDMNGIVLNWNPGILKIKGYNREEITGMDFRNFYSDADRTAQIPDKLLQIALQTGRATHEGWRIKKDGTRFWGSIVITTLHAEDGKAIGFSKLTRDLTEKRILEEKQIDHARDLEKKHLELRRSEEKYHKMIAEVEDYAIILLDSNGTILNWNKGAENIKGYSESEILGKNFRQFYRPEDQAAQLPEKLLAEAIQNNRSEHEGWRVRKDGTHFWGSIVITALHDSSGDITGFSKVTRDLTEKKQFEDRILTQNKQLEEYAYVASHDLQEPLRKITMFSGLLKDSMDDPDAVIKYIEKIQSATSRMTKLIKAVLEYSQAIDIMGLRTEVDLNQVVQEIETDFEVLLQERNGRITYPQLPVITAIPIQMHQLFSNLINNSLKFSDGPPEIVFTIESPDNSHIRITVSDNGIGFDPAYTDRIFKMFHKLHDKGTGTGIGLALCKRIVEGHGGTISATSVPGKGTTFEIILPIK